MTFTTAQITTLVLVAVLGHVMALVWYLAARYRWRFCSCAIYDVPVEPTQLRREAMNSLHTPMRALILAGFLALGCFQSFGWPSFFVSLLLTTVWGEVFHYVAHYAMHWKPLHWIHVEHHKSRVNTCLTALSFSFTEQLVCDVGIIAPLALLDHYWGLNFFGVAGWFVGYLVINSFSHANFEFKSEDFSRFFGRFLTTTVFHSLHHSRYVQNYGLGTRVLDQVCRTEWSDYEETFDRVVRDKRPLTRLGEKAEPAKADATKSAAEAMPIGEQPQ